jgi:hypothetical protein
MSSRRPEGAADDVPEDGAVSPQLMRAGPHLCVQRSEYSSVPAPAHSGAVACGVAKTYLKPRKDPDQASAPIYALAFLLAFG